MTHAGKGLRTTHVCSWRDYRWFVTRREKCPEITPGSALFKVVEVTGCCLRLCFGESPFPWRGFAFLGASFLMDVVCGRVFYLCVYPYAKTRARPPASRAMVSTRFSSTLFDAPTSRARVRPRARVERSNTLFSTRRRDVARTRCKCSRSPRRS